MVVEKLEDMPKKKIYSIFIILSVFLADFLTKTFAVNKLLLYKSEPVTSFMNFTLAFNYGAAFSFLSDAGGWQRWFLSLVSFSVSGFIFFWIFRLKPSERLLGFALAIILGGAIGNLIDRVLLGHVVDFILLYHSGFFFPTFNVADAAISVGAILLIIEMFYKKKGG